MEFLIFRPLRVRQVVPIPVFEPQFPALKANGPRLARINAVRDAVGEGPVLYADWNAGSTSYEATRVGRAVRDLDIMLEQPCDGLDACVYE